MRPAFRIKRFVRFRQAEWRVSSFGSRFRRLAAERFNKRVEVEPGRFLVSGAQNAERVGDLREEFEPTFANRRGLRLAGYGRRPHASFLRCTWTDRPFDQLTIRWRLHRAIEPFRIYLRDANDNDCAREQVARGQFDTPHEEEFDVFRYLVRVTDRLGGDRTVVTTFETGPMGGLLAVVDGRGQKFRYRYDRMGNRIELMLRDAGNRKLWYDAGKRLVRSVDGQGNDLRAVWDPVGRLQRLSNGAETLEEYTYDTPGQNAVGRLAAVDYPGGSQAFHYDERARIVRHEYHHEGFSGPLAVRYDIRSARTRDRLHSRRRHTHRKAVPVQRLAEGNSGHPHKRRACARVFPSKSISKTAFARDASTRQGPAG